MTEPPAPHGHPLPDDAVDAYAAGELSAADAERVRALGGRDPALAARLAAAARVEAALRAQEPAVVPLGLVAATLARLDAEGASGETPWGSRWEGGAPAEEPALRTRLGRTAVAAAAAALIALGGWGLLEGSDAPWTPLEARLPAIESVVAAPSLPRVPGLTGFPTLSEVGAWPARAAGSTAAGPAALVTMLLGVGIAVGRAAVGRAGGPRGRESGTRCAG